jgi:hypothetical protein
MKMISDRESKMKELKRLYDLLWQPGSALNQALVRAKIGMVSAELAKIEMTDHNIPRPDLSGNMKM